MARGNKILQLEWPHFPDQETGTDKGHSAVKRSDPGGGDKRGASGRKPHARDRLQSRAEWIKSPSQHPEARELAFLALLLMSFTAVHAQSLSRV